MWLLLAVADRCFPEPLTSDLEAAAYPALDSLTSPGDARTTWSVSGGSRAAWCG